MAKLNIISSVNAMAKPPIQPRPVFLLTTIPEIHSLIDSSVTPGGRRGAVSVAFLSI
jgi:hypothetical protein